MGSSPTVVNFSISRSLFSSPTSTAFVIQFSSSAFSSAISFSASAFSMLNLSISSDIATLAEVAPRELTSGACSSSLLVTSSSSLAWAPLSSSRSAFNCASCSSELNIFESADALDTSATSCSSAWLRSNKSLRSLSSLSFWARKPSIISCISSMLFSCFDLSSISWSKRSLNFDSSTSTSLDLETCSAIPDACSCKVSSSSRSSRVSPSLSSMRAIFSIKVAFSDISSLLVSVNACTFFSVSAYFFRRLSCSAVASFLSASASARTASISAILLCMSSLAAANASCSLAS
mmetsp:Transcript_40294/g.160069  ORF Transcript_40294/g.160069 Transcript_40294/m.160069 type:complete len:291 (+) Transcript_40294:2713-3585(+)